ncbi:hypothetical protein ACHAXR_002921 [Thalassiosira sp. AJA248-18]
MANDDDAAETVVEEVHTATAAATTTSSSEANFKMTPKMVAYELAANIEDIFADHDVEIVAVDADDDDEDDDNDMSDDDTFVSARSMRSMKSIRSVRSQIRKIEQQQQNKNKAMAVVAVEENDKPLLEITTKKKKPRKPRKSKYDSYEEDDMMLQIEAMARQADAAFESRKSKTRNTTLNVEGGAAASLTHSVVIEPAEPKISAIEEEEDNEVKENEGINKEVEVLASIDEEVNVTADDVLGAMKSMATKNQGIVAVESAPTTANQRDALSRNFLNTSTSMVSTMVAASQGRVNEVHVLQYLGVTIVCIAANFMQQGAGRGGGPTNVNPGFGAKEVFQSAMFLAFMVNGQRYLAKVTKK